MEGEISLADMTAHEAELWQEMVEPDEDPLHPQPTTVSGPPSDQSEDAGEEGDDEPQQPLPKDLDADLSVLEVPQEEGSPPPPAELTIPDEPDTLEETLEIPGGPGNADMGPAGTVDAPPDTAEPVLPVADSAGDEFFPGEGPVDMPPLPEDPELDLPEEPDAAAFDLNDWSIKTTMDYTGGRRLAGRENVIDVNLSVPPDFEERLGKHIEPQMGLLRNQVMDHTANVIEENAIIGSMTGVPI